MSRHVEDIRKYPAQYDSCLLFVGDVCVSVGGEYAYIYLLASFRTAR